jgi:hypothetical protein
MEVLHTFMTSHHNTGCIVWRYRLKHRGNIYPASILPRREPIQASIRRHVQRDVITSPLNHDLVRALPQTGREDRIQPEHDRLSHDLIVPYGESKLERCIVELCREPSVDTTLARSTTAPIRSE